MYDDIINLERPKSNRPSMNRADRAKIFMPFAALKGYDDAVEEKKKLRTDKIELSMEKKDELDFKIQLLEQELVKGLRPNVNIKYFQKDLKASLEEGRELGVYVQIEGEIKRIDRFNGVLMMESCLINIGEIVEILLKKSYTI